MLKYNKIIYTNCNNHVTVSTTNCGKTIINNDLDLIIKLEFLSSENKNKKTELFIQPRTVQIIEDEEIYDTVVLHIEKRQMSIGNYCYNCGKKKKYAGDFYNFFDGTYWETICFDCVDGFIDNENIENMGFYFRKKTEE